MAEDGFRGERVVLEGEGGNRERGLVKCVEIRRRYIAW